MAKKNNTKLTWSPIRDELLVALINGVTKCGTHKDRRKEANRRACRGKVLRED